MVMNVCSARSCRVTTRVCKNVSCGSPILTRTIWVVAIFNGNRLTCIVCNYGLMVNTCHSMLVQGSDNCCGIGTSLGFLHTHGNYCSCAAAGNTSPECVTVAINTLIEIQ